MFLNIMLLQTGDWESNSLIKLWAKHTFESRTRCKLHVFMANQRNKKDIKPIFLHRHRSKCLGADLALQLIKQRQKPPTSKHT